MKLIKISWRVFFKPEFRGFEGYDYFTYCTYDKWMKAIEDIGTCISQLIEAGAVIERVESGACQVDTEEVTNWKALFE